MVHLDECGIKESRRVVLLCEPQSRKKSRFFDAETVIRTRAIQLRYKVDKPILAEFGNYYFTITISFFLPFFYFPINLFLLYLSSSTFFEQQVSK